MPKYIETPSGIAEFPDGMEDAAIESVLRSQFKPATEASAAKGLARAVLGQQFRQPAMPKAPAAPVLADPDVRKRDELLSMPATPDPAGWRTLKEIDAAKNIAPPMPKVAVPFGLQQIPTPSRRSDIGDVGMAMGDTSEGMRRMAEFQTAGAKEAAAGAGQMVAPNQPLERRVMGASRAFRGGMQAALPAMLPVMGAAAMAAPAATAFGMVAGTAAQEGVERGAKAVGVPEGYARAAGDLAGLPGYMYGPFRALRPKVPTTTGIVDDAIATPPSIADDVPVAAPEVEARIPEVDAQVSPTPLPPKSPVVNLPGGFRSYTAQGFETSGAVPQSSLFPFTSIDKKAGPKSVFGPPTWKAIKAPKAKPDAQPAGKVASTPEQAAVSAADAGSPQGAALGSLAGAKPSYGFGEKRFSLEFENDADLAAYIASSKKPSKNAKKYLEFAQSALGTDADGVKSHGAALRESIKGIARDAESGTAIRVPSRQTPDAPTKRIIPEPTGDAPVRPDAADVAAQPQPAAQPAAAPATVADTLTKLQDGADAPVPIGRLRDAGITDDQILEAWSPDGIALWESHLNAGHPDVKANPKDFLIHEGKAYNVAVHHPDAPSRRDTQRGSFSRKPKSDPEAEVYGAIRLLRKDAESPVTIADLKDAVGEEAAEHVDSVLMAMFRRGEVSLMPIANNAELLANSRLQDGAMWIGENPRHLVYPTKTFNPRRDTQRGSFSRKPQEKKPEKRWRLEAFQNGEWTEWNTYPSYRAAARAESDISSGSMANAFGTGRVSTRINEYVKEPPATPSFKVDPKREGGGWTAAMDSADQYSHQVDTAKEWVRRGLYPDIESAMDAVRISPRRDTQRGSFSRKPRGRADADTGASKDESYEEVKQPQGPEDDFLNFGRIKVTPDEESALRQTMRGMIDQGELVKDVEPHANIIQEAKRIHPDLVREVSAEAAKDGLTSRAAVLSARERMNAINAQILKHIEKRNDPSLDSSERAEIDGQIAAMESNVKEYLKVTSGIRTNFGRNLASLKIIADNTLDFGTWMYKAAKARGLGDASSVPDKDRSAIRDLISKAEDALSRGDGKAADDAKFELARHVSKLQETGWLDTISALRKAGLLTGLRTHARNIGGNTLFAAMEEAARLPGAFVDVAVSAGTGRRTTVGPSVIGMKNAAHEAATRGVEEARQIMSRGMTKADMKAGDLPKDLNFQKLRHMAEDMPEGALKAALGRTNDMVNTYVNTVFRSLGAEDRVFRVYAMRRSIEAQAKLKAMNEKLSGAKLKARVAELTKSPSDLMISEAIAYSQFATFNTENSLAQMVTRGRAQLPAIGRSALDLVIPFVNTPMEVAARGSNYIPGTNFIPFARKGYAAAKNVSAARHQMKRGAITKDEYATVKDLMGDQAQRAFSEAVGRGAVGTAIMLAGYMAAKEGKAIGLREENDAMRTVKQAAGQQDGSVLVGGKWRQVSSFTPTATLFLMGASMYDQSTRKISNETKRPWIMAGTYAKAIADTPMLQGVGMAGDALKDPAKFGEQMISQTAGSFVPTAVSDLSRVIDPSRKEFKPPEGGVFSPALYGIQGRLPFARSSQPNARDVFGKGLGGERSYAVDPFSSSEAKEQSDPMLKMMLDARVGIKPVDKLAGESQAHYRGRQALAGAAIEKELRRINPGRLPSDPGKRDKIIKKAISVGRKKARTVWNSKRFLDNPEDRRAEILEQLAERVRRK